MTLQAPHGEGSESGDGRHWLPISEDARQRISDLAKDGLLTKEAVVNDARSPSSPLHRYFDWIDTVAAEKWRLHQGQTLIRRFRFTSRTTTTEVEFTAPKFVKTFDVGSGYSDLETIREEAQRGDWERGARSMVYALRPALGHVERCCNIARALDWDDLTDGPLDDAKRAIRVALEDAERYL